MRTPPNATGATAATPDTSGTWELGSEKARRTHREAALPTCPSWPLPATDSPHRSGTRPPNKGMHTGKSPRDTAEAEDWRPPATPQERRNCPNVACCLCTNEVACGIQLLGVTSPRRSPRTTRGCAHSTGRLTERASASLWKFP